MVYDNPPWKVLRANSESTPSGPPGPTCMAANTRTDRAAALMIFGRTIQARIVVYSPLWNFPKVIGKSHLARGLKEGVTFPNSEYDGQYVTLWTGDDPQIAFVMVFAGGANDLVLTGLHDEELASFSMGDYKASFKAFETCVFGF